MKKVAAIDIGSNAIRLAIATADELELYKIVKKLRAPLRLGSEAFGLKKFSDQTINEAIKVFEEFKSVMDEEKVTDYKAVATSAYRDAENSHILGQKVFEKTNIEIEKISGDLEANMIRKAIEDHIDIKDDNFLLMDIGGGSMELSYLKKGNLKGNKSFNLGTVRLLEQAKHYDDPNKAYSEIIESHFHEIHEFLAEYVNPKKYIRMIGTGGNFKRMLKLKRKLIGPKDANFFRPEDLPFIYSILENTSYEKRIKKYSLRPDRADVIMPAIALTLAVTSEIKVKKVYTPEIGLIDGVIEELILRN